MNFPVPKFKLIHRVQDYTAEKHEANYYRSFALAVTLGGNHSFPKQVVVEGPLGARHVLMFFAHTPKSKPKT